MTLGDRGERGLELKRAPRVPPRNPTSACASDPPAEAEDDVGATTGFDERCGWHRRRKKLRVALDLVRPAWRRYVNTFCRGRNKLHQPRRPILENLGAPPGRRGLHL